MNYWETNRGHNSMPIIEKHLRTIADSFGETEQKVYEVKSSDKLAQTMNDIIAEGYTIKQILETNVYYETSFNTQTKSCDHIILAERKTA